MIFFGVYGMECPHQHRPQQPPTPPQRKGTPFFLFWVLECPPHSPRQSLQEPYPGSHILGVCKLEGHSGRPPWPPDPGRSSQGSRGPLIYGAPVTPLGLAGLSFLLEFRGLGCSSWLGSVECKQRLVLLQTLKALWGNLSPPPQCMATPIVVSVLYFASTTRCLPPAPVGEF